MNRLFMTEGVDGQRRKKFTSATFYFFETLLFISFICINIEDVGDDIVIYVSETAPGEEKEWEGLGYYSRARHLHAGAQHVDKVHGGDIPCDEKALSQIKGLGPYTVGAIRSFAFHQKAAAVDGNVVRVIARLCGIHGDVAK